MNARPRTILPILLISLLLFAALAACGGPPPTATPVPTPTPLPTGSISGLMIYENFSKPEIIEPLPGTLIVLCKIPDEGLPEGPLVGSANVKGVEPVCTMVGEPTAVSGNDGTFTIEDVPTGTYLVLFTPFPEKLEEAGIEWDGIPVTEAIYDEINKGIPASGKADLWQKGGEVIALGRWSIDEGTVLTSGNVCSDGFGFCFSLLEEALSPVVVVEPGKTVVAEVKSHFLPEE